MWIVQISAEGNMHARFIRLSMKKPLQQATQTMSRAYHSDSKAQSEHGTGAMDDQ